MKSLKRAQRASKTPRESTFVTRKVVMPDELNPNGTLFGGIIMSWIDEVAFMSARRYSGRPFVVTANIDNITFLSPLRNGDHVVLTSQVNHAGRSSMEIGVKVEKEDPYTGDRSHTTSAYLTFVALDERSKPCLVPQLILETPEDHRRHEEAIVRVKVRERVKAYLKRKVQLAKQIKDEPKTIEKRKIFSQMTLHLKDALDRYQRFSKGK
ncbi:MAG: acyl-CoA thioesterase [Bacteriovoracia bacterium]